MGEATDGVVESTSKLQEKLKALTGVDILTDTGAYKDTYTILKEIGAVWQDLESLDKSAALELMAGKNRANTLSAILNNMSDLEGAYESALQSQNSALKENETYLNSIQGKIDKFNNALQTMWNNELNSDIIKDFVDLGRVLVELIDKLGIFNTLVGAIFTKFAIVKKSFGNFFTIGDDNKVSAGEWGNWFKNIFSKKDNPAAKAIDDIGKSAEKASGKVIDFADAQKRQAAAGNGAAASNKTVDTTQKAVGASSVAASIGVKALNAALSFGLGMLISWVASGIIGFFDDFIHRQERLKEAAEDLKTTFQDTKSTIDGNLKTLTGLEDEFERLSRGVDDYGNNISLAADDYDRYCEIVSTILGISPSLISGYDAEGNAIANKNGLLEQSIALMKEEQRLRMQEFVSDENLATVGMGAVASIAGYEKENPLPYGDAMSNFRKKFAEVANNFDVRGGEFVNNYDLFKLFSPEGYNWSDYSGGAGASTYASNFGADFYDQIIYSLRNERDKFKDQLTQEEIDALLEIASEYENNVSVYNKRIEEYSRAFNPTLQYVPQTLTAYNELTDGQKEFLTQYINGFRITADTTEEDIKQMKQDILDFTEFVASNEGLNKSINLGTSIKRGVDGDGNELTVSEYKAYVDELNQQIESYGEEEQAKIKLSLGIKTDASEINADVDQAVEHVKNLLIDDYDGLVDDMSISDILKIYYNISADPNSMTIDELKEELYLVGVDWNKTVDAFDFSTMTDGLDKVESSVSSLVSAMESLREGTQLSKGELTKLALEYPELLKSSNLFKDGSIANQEALLQAIMDTYEAEYDALIDTKIAELTATQTLIESQLDLENQKAQKILEIETLQSNGKIESAIEYQRIADELRDLEGKNYVTFSDGILSVNQDMLEKQIEQEKEKVEDTRPLFEAQGNMIVESNFKGVDGALKAFPKYATELTKWAGTSLKAVLSNIGTNIGKAFRGETDWVDLTDGIEDIGNILQDNSVTLETSIEGDYTIEDKSVNEWAEEYKKIIEERKKLLEEQKVDLQNTIDNLEALKGLDLLSIYEDDGSSKYATELFDMIEGKLEEIEKIIAKTSAELENIKDDGSTINTKNALYDKLVEQEKLKANTYGSAVDIYNYMAQKFFEKIPEQYRDLAQAGGIAVEDFIGESESEHADAIKSYREWAQKAHDAEVGELEAIAEMSAIRLKQLKDIADDFDNVIGLTESKMGLLQANMDLVEASGGRLSDKYYDTLIQDTNKTISTLENKRNAMQNVLNNAVKDGDITVGSDDWYEAVNAIIAVDEQIVQCRIDTEEWKNAIQELKWDNLNKLTTELNNVESQLSHFYDLLSDDADVVDEFGNWTDEGYASLGLLTQRMELAQYNAEQYAQAIRDLDEDYKKGLYSTDEYNEKIAELTENQWESVDAYESAKDEIVALNKVRIDAVKKGMEEEIDAYKELIDLKKESLDEDKKAREFADNVTEKEKKIATLERQLAAIKNNTSAEATAKRKQLQAELLKARAELEDFYYDHSVDIQKEALDNEYEAFEKNKQDEMDKLDEWLKDTEKVVEESTQLVQNNAETVLNTLKETVTTYGIEISDIISDAVISPWEDGANAIANYEMAFGSVAESFIEKLGAIKQAQQDLIDQADQHANNIISDVSANYAGVTSGKTIEDYSDDYFEARKNLDAAGMAAANAGANAIRRENGEEESWATDDIPYIQGLADELQEQKDIWNKTYEAYQNGEISGQEAYDAMKAANDRANEIRKEVGADIQDASAALDKIPHHAKGTLGIKRSGLSWVDEMGLEEIVMHAGPNGRLQYLTKGSAVIPHDISENLMKLGQLDPSQVLEQSKVHLGAPHITTNNMEINLHIGEVVHVDHADSGSIPDIAKAVQLQMDRYMQNINSSLKKKVR